MLAGSGCDLERGATRGQHLAQAFQYGLLVAIGSSAEGGRKERDGDAPLQNGPGRAFSPSQIAAMTAFTGTLSAPGT